LDIYDWWNRTRRADGTLKLSSRRLMVLLDCTPEESSFRLAATEDWSHTRKLLASTVNELRIMRVENVVAGGGEYQDPQLIKTPGQELADQFDSEKKQAIRAGIMSQLHQGV
jgi:hypothetical protein